MKNQFLVLFSLTATISSVLAQFPTDVDEPSAGVWYFDNAGEGTSVLGADANLRDAYTTTSREITADGSNFTYDGGVYSGQNIVIAVVADGIAPHPEFFDVDNDANAADPGALGAFNFGGNWIRPTGAASPSVLMASGLNLNPGLRNSIFALPTGSEQFQGTSAAGLIGASNDGNGIAGVAYNSVMLPIRVTGSSFRTTANDAAALLHGLGAPGAFDETQNTSIYFAGFGAPATNDAATTRLNGLSLNVANALQTGVTQGRGGNGAIYVVPAGDSGLIDGNSNEDGYANSPFTIAVGAFTDTDVGPEYSEPGANVVVVAPSGGGTRNLNLPSFTTGGDGEFYAPPATLDQPLGITFESAVRVGQTNASASIASGVIALMLEARNAVIAAATTSGQAVVPQPLGWRDVQNILIRTARQNDPDHPDWSEPNSDGRRFNHSYGWGAIDAAAAVRMAETTTVLGERQEIERVEIFNEQIPDDNGSPFFAEFDLSNDPNLIVEHVVVNVTAFDGRRSDLNINLISPSGSISRLNESTVGGTEREIFDFPFMSVRNWGENSQGVWTVFIEDRVTGEEMTLDSIVFTVYGTSAPDAPPTGNPVILSSVLIEGVQGNPLEAEIVTTGLASNGLTFENLPEGLSLDVRVIDGRERYFITGTPTGSGVSVADATLQGAANTVTQTFTFSIEPVNVAFGDSIGVNGLDGVTGGDALWEIVTDADGDGFVFDDGRAIASPAELDDNQRAILAFDNVPGEIATFYWAVNSEEGSDRLFVSNGGPAPQNHLAFIDGARDSDGDGNIDYGIVGIQFPNSSNNTIQWTYAKDVNDDLANVAFDRGFVDALRLYTSAELFINNPNSTGSEGGLVQQAGMNFIPHFDSRTIWVPVDAPEGILGRQNNDDRVLQASKIGDGQQVSMAYWSPAEAQNTLLSFDYLVSSEVGNDVLEVLVNGVATAGTINIAADGTGGVDVSAVEISGVTPMWQRAEVMLPANRRNYVQIIYRKNSTISEGLDTALIDNIRIGNTLPLSLALSDDVDTDGDGNSDFAEYAFGGDPNVRDTLPNLPIFLPADDNILNLEIPIDSLLEGEIHYQLQESTDLETWTNVGRTLTLNDVRNGMNIYSLPVFAGSEGPTKYYRLTARPR